MKKLQLLFLITLFFIGACSKDDEFKGFNEVGVDVSVPGDELVSDVKILVYDALKENVYVKTIDGSKLTLNDLEPSVYNLIAIGNSEGLLENKEDYSTVKLLQHAMGEKNLYVAMQSEYKFPADLENLSLDLQQVTGILKVASTDVETADYDSLSISVVVPKGKFDIVSKMNSGDAVTLTKGFKTNGGLNFEAEFKVFSGSVTVNVEMFKARESVYSLDLGTAAVVAGGSVAIDKSFNDEFPEQFIEIPDDNFRTLLKRKLPDAFNGDVFDTKHESIAALTALYAQYEGIENFTGLEYLYALTDLDIQGNGDATGALDLSGMKDLVYLNTSYCGFTSVDVAGLDKLESFTCELMGVTSLDISTCSSLAFFDFANNFKMTTITFGSHPDLTMIVGYDCALEGTIDLTGLTALNTAYLDRNNLSGINISGLALLEDLGCSANALTSLDLKGCSSIVDLSCSENQLTTLDLSACVALDNIDCSQNLLTSLDLSASVELTWLTANVNSLSSLNITGLDKLRNLFINENKLGTLDVSTCTALKSLVVDDNELTTLDLSANTEIARVGCSTNRLTSLDFSNLTKLMDVDCSNNELSSLDITGCAWFGSLDCTGVNQTFTDITGLADAPDLMTLSIPNSAICGANILSYYTGMPSYFELKYQDDAGDLQIYDETTCQ